VNFPVSYTLDAFGANRRQIEGLRAQAENSAFQLRAAYLTLTANIVTTTITAASLAGQIQATQDIIANTKKTTYYYSKTTHSRWCI